MTYFRKLSKTNKAKSSILKTLGDFIDMSRLEFPLYRINQLERYRVSLNLTRLNIEIN